MADAFRPKPPTCAGCDWRDAGRGYAAGSGDPSSDVWVIAESAGRAEAESGRPLTAYTGKQVDAALARGGVPRDQTYCDNVVRCMPPVSPGKQKKIPKNVIDYCTSVHLRPVLDAHSPKVIIALGEYSLHYLTGRNKITKNRGSIIPRDNSSSVIVPTIHYAAFAHGAGEKKAGRLQVLKPYVDYDFVKACEISRTGPPSVLRNYTIRPTLPRIRSTITRIKTERIPCFVDIETCGGSWWDTLPLCMGIFFHDEGLCIPFYGHRGEAEWVPDEFDEVVDLVGDFLADENVEKTFWNGNYDVTVLESVGF